MPPRYPHLPPALLRLLEAGPWEGTPTELYATLEAHRVGAMTRVTLALSARAPPTPAASPQALDPKSPLKPS
ncbi:hypothetical protein [Meiothermus taiwanensis]|uniref:Uncharacterized protein n=1 Tax=Meiothermus taiwanensis WR-220 TaxID=1339250 RepID=A0ABM6WFP1_9DEIN|nr:hypothetical protein [Meiothermus taiwanensis]AWR85669.1 hypothetical protein Mtai_v1c04210 [Meiothermus taiwanensis WR-220]